MRALRVALLHLRVSVMNELQYRANFFIQLIQSLISVATGLIVLALIFDRTPDLNGWTRPQLLVVLGIYSIVGGFFGFGLEPAVVRIMGDVREGTFDYVLTKPVDSQVLASVRAFRVWRLTDVVVGIAVATWGLVALPNPPSLTELAGGVVMLMAGFVALYCLGLIIVTGAFWYTNMDMVQDLFTGMYRAGQYPTGVYPRWLRLVLTFLVPIGLAVTTPSQSLTGQLTWQRLVALLGFVTALVVVTRLIWKLGTKRYSGASA
ncbi:MAG TPA: ABC-2 family transporter protein [Ilumatobacter sp.]|nr:ABC-2 family transporter protein [Ilumatobacter sp.]